MEKTFQLKLTKETYIKAKSLDEAKRFLEVFAERDTDEFAGSFVIVTTEVEPVVFA